MSTYQTRKDTAAGRVQTLHRKSVRAVKYSGGAW